MLQYSHRGLSKQSYNSLTPTNPIVNEKLVPNIRNGTLKTEYPIIKHIPAALAKAKAQAAAAR